MENYSTAESQLFYNFGFLHNRAQISSLPEESVYSIKSQIISDYQLNPHSNPYKIDFMGDIWDMSHLMKDPEVAPHTKLIFSGFPDDLKLFLKLYFKFKIEFDSLGPTSIHQHLSHLRSTLSPILIENPELVFETITTEHIINEIQSRNLTPYSAHSNYQVLSDFYSYLINNCRIPLLISPDKLKKLDKEAIELDKREDKRLPNIPIDLAERIESTATMILRDESALYEDRLIACIIIILLKTGIRIQDILSFKTDCLTQRETANNKYIVHYISYGIKKISRYRQSIFKHDIYASPKCAEAIITIQSLRQSSNSPETTDFLFIVDGIPLNVNKYKILYKRFMYKFLKPDSTNKENEALFKSAKLDDGKTTIYCPESRQYRVFICNQLIAKGVSKTFIEEHLKHLSESMADYYARPEDKTEEYIGYAEEIIKDIVQDNLSPIGCMGEELKKSILNYLKTQKITSKTDIEEIFDILGPKVSIRAKTGGFCFKTTLIPCAEEAGVNKILCAYNLCPNVYSFYYMLDATYTSVKALIESYDQNLMRGYYQSANKDLNDAKSIIARILDKQIIQLGQEMESKGTDYISEKYPHMIPYMSNYESIKEQIKEWKNMKPARG